MEINTALTIISTLLPFLINSAGKALENMNSELWEVIKEKFREKNGDKELIENFASNPDDVKLQAVVEYRLEQCIREDQKFADNLQFLLKKLPNPETNNIKIEKIYGTSNITIQDVSGSSIATNKK